MADVEDHQETTARSGRALICDSAQQEGRDGKSHIGWLARLRDIVDNPNSPPCTRLWLTYNKSFLPHTREFTIYFSEELICL